MSPRTNRATTPQSRALDNIAAAIRTLAGAMTAPPPGPCPSAHAIPRWWAFDQPVVLCELLAGHDGEHLWHAPNNTGYARWTDAGASARQAATGDLLTGPDDLP